MNVLPAVESSKVGGEGGIRTHGGLAPTAVFKTAALNHSATSPDRGGIAWRAGPCKARGEPSWRTGGFTALASVVVRSVSWAHERRGRWSVVGGFARLGRCAGRRAGISPRPARPSYPYSQPAYIRPVTDALDDLQDPPRRAGPAAGRQRGDHPGAMSRTWTSTNGSSISNGPSRSRGAAGASSGRSRPIFDAHVTPSLISRGQDNYADHYQRSVARSRLGYGVDPAVLMAI